MDAVGIVLMGAGAFLAYSAVKGTHPWTAFLTVLGKSSAQVVTAELATAASAPNTPTVHNPLAGGGNL